MALNVWDSAQLCLAAYLHASLCHVYLSDQARTFFYLLYVFSCVSIYESLFCCFWMSLTLCAPFYLYFCVFLHEPPGSISLYLCSGCLWDCVSEGMYLCFCIFPCMYLPLSLFLSVPVGIVCGSCLFAPIYVGITEWVSQCVHFSLYVSLLSMPVGQ